jgi:UDP-N-acetyl-D-mannosaminuronate dehydrogenase
LTEDREIDFRILRAASADVGAGLRPGALVVYETTLSIGGTRRELIPVLEEHSGLTSRFESTL